MPQDRAALQLGEINSDSRPACFVVMPFDTLYKKEYDSVIKPTVEAAGLTCVRGDEIYTRVSIIQDVWASIRSARLVIAELSGRDANVMYEVGMAHAVGKPVILLARQEDDVPFDLKDIRCVIYDTTEPDWGQALRDTIAARISDVLQHRRLAFRLDDIVVEAASPATLPIPTQPNESMAALPRLDLSGEWQGSWLGMASDLEHQATLVIPLHHGNAFTARVTVAYERSAQRTMVEEALSATINGRSLALVGVNYSYVERGASVAYSLDSFHLLAATDGRSLAGQVLLRQGERDITFVRVRGPAQQPAAS